MPNEVRSMPQGQVSDFIQTWSNMHIPSAEYPLTLRDAQMHADACLEAAGNAGISQSEIEKAIRGKDLREIMVLNMRAAADDRLSARRSSNHGRA